jgi:A/G-specific adenine glycosylase
MLDLGATVCAKRAPACDRCPVVAGCAWGSAGRPEPDPAVGSHAVSRGQSRFEGSFRQGRARLLDVVRLGAPVPSARWVAGCGWTDRVDGVVDAERAAATLVADGLAVLTEGGELTLP